MAKLKVKSRPITVDKVEGDMYHCCRWCHYFDNGYCLNDSVSAELDGSIVEVEKHIEIQNGKERVMWEIEAHLGELDEVSDKAIRQLLDVFAGDVLGVEVSGKVAIENPSEHYCREFF